MTIRISIHCNNIEAVEKLNGMIKRTKDFRTVFEWARIDLQRANAENFNTSGLPVGGWSPLKPRYAAWKAIHFPGAPIMVQDGKLFKSLTDLRGSPNKIRRMEAEFGTKVDYAKFHQYGTTKMPKRQIVFEPVGFAYELAKRSAKYVVDGVLE